jgi:hypothetical protein
MIKNLKANDAPITKGVLDEALGKMGAELIFKIGEVVNEKIESAIGSLAIMVEEGFQGMAAQMNEKFAQIDERFKQVDKRFAQIDERFVQIEKRFEQVDRRFAQIDGQFKQIDIQFGRVFSELKDVRKEVGVNNLKTRGDVAGIDLRIEKLEKKAGY